MNALSNCQSKHFQMHESGGKLFNLSSDHLSLILKALNISNDQLNIVANSTSNENRPLNVEKHVVSQLPNCPTQTFNFNLNYTQEEQMSCDECNWIVRDLAKIYANDYHAYLALAICLFGTFANVINIVVLTRKEMAAAPINRILTGLAVADMMVMVEYKLYAYYYHIELPKKRNFPYWGAVFVLFHIHFTQVFHTISICLTLTLAIWRYMAIGYPERSHILCSDQRCTLAIACSYILPVILCIPTYFIFEVTSTIVTEDKDYTLYFTGLSKIAQENDSYLVFNFWVYAVVIKLIPCFVLTIISCWLIRTLFKAKRRKQVLRGYNVVPTITEANGKNKKKTSKAERRADRTTKMLVAVLLLFLLTEFPQGIFGLMSGMKGKCFFLKCYQDFGELMDMMALLNGSINFVLYCCMNRMFRATFGQLFSRKILDKWSPPALSDVQTTTFANGTNTTEL